MDFLTELKAWFRMEAQNPDHPRAVKLYPCRNCEDRGVRHDRGLCYECWHLLYYGRPAEPNHLRGDGAAKNLPAPGKVKP